MKKALKWMIVGVALAFGVQAGVVWDESFGLSAWDEDFSGVLSSNWTGYAAGAGAGVTQSNSTMVLDTGVVGGSAQGAVNTTTDQSGAVSDFNGEALYNFYEHPVKTRFDIASISGSGNDVFYYSIGYDAGGNYMPQTGVLDDGIGFRLSSIGDGTQGVISGHNMVSGVATGGDLATVSGVPTAITYTMDGTTVTIALEGATFPYAVPAVTRIDASTIQTTVDDLSANLTDYVMAFGAYNLGTGTEKTVVTLDALSVEVGGALNENWTESAAGAGAGVTQSLTNMVLDTGVAGGSAQGALNTTTDQTGAVSNFNGEALYNFYDHQVQARYDIASISGSNGSGRNVFYFSIGDDAAGNHMPQANVLDDGVGFWLEQLDTGGGPFWRILFTASSNSTHITSRVVAEISDVPTALTYTLNGTQAAIEMEGATNTAVAWGISGTVGGSEMTFPMPDVSAMVSGYTMAFGAYNLGTVAEKTVVTIDALTVSVEAPSYSTWAASWGVDIGSETNDYDGDLVDNLGEYGLNGDPTDDTDRGQTSVAIDGTDLVYTHALRGGDPNLAYWLETTDDLVSPNWTNTVYWGVATNVTGETFDFVTNTIPTTADQTFIRLRIQNN